MALKKVYSRGTVIKYSKKALRKHSNHFKETDRIIVLDEGEGIWYNNETKRIYNQFACFAAHDSFVEKAEEEIPELIFDLSKLNVVIEEEEIRKLAKEFNIKLIGDYPIRGSNILHKISFIITEDFIKEILKSKNIECTKENIENYVEKIKIFEDKLKEQYEEKIKEQLWNL